MYVPQQYPKWVQSSVTGLRIVVEDHHEHSTHVGYEVGPDGLAVFIKPLAAAAVSAPVPPAAAIKRHLKSK